MKYFNLGPVIRGYGPACGKLVQLVSSNSVRNGRNSSHDSRSNVLRNVFRTRVALKGCQRTKRHLCNKREDVAMENNARDDCALFTRYTLLPQI